MKTETLDSISTAGNVTTWTGAAIGGLLTFLISNFVGLVGILIALLGFWVNSHYKSKADKRRQAEEERNQIAHNLEMELRKVQSDQWVAESKQRAAYMELRMEILRAGGNPGPVPTDFGALAPAAGPWSETQPPEVGDEHDGS